MAASGSALTLQALRLNARYIDEVVVGWGLCPWAERALREGQVRRRVFLDETPAAAAALAFIDELGADAQASIGFAIFPRAAAAAAAFDAFAEQVRRADRARGAPAFLVAAFHPSGATSFTSAPRLVSFVRRTPDPTLQLVRASLLERLPAGASDDVGRQNFAAVTARGADALDALLRDIRRDRDQSYARLGEPASTF
jgi:hypothetical protein